VMPRKIVKDRLERVGNQTKDSTRARERGGLPRSVEQGRRGLTDAWIRMRRHQVQLVAI
jgi:hypothetical protein